MNRDRLSAAGGWALDALLTLLAVTFLLFGSRQAAAGHVPPRRPLDAIVYVVLALAGVALMSRRRAPAALFALEVLLGAFYLVRGYPYGPLLAVVGFTAYGFARRRDTAATSVATASAALALVFAYGIGYAPSGWHGILAAVVQAGWVLVPALMGGLVREAHAALARADAEAAGRHVEQERLRVAREVHDVVGHGLSVISLQAGVALHVLERRPEQARPALEAIRAASIMALDELRVTLEPDASGDHRSTGGLGRLGAILEQVRVAGLAVEVETVGVARALSPEVDLAALRVVQESLTNVLRHAGPASARVQLRYEPEAIVVAVSDDGGPDPAGAAVSAGSGRGLDGLGQRARELGGGLDAGWASGGGWRVTAVLPFGAGPGALS